MKFTKIMCFSTRIYVINGINPRKITWWYVATALQVASMEDRYLVVTFISELRKEQNIDIGRKKQLKFSGHPNIPFFCKLFLHTKLFNKVVKIRQIHVTCVSASPLCFPVPHSTCSGFRKPRDQVNSFLSILHLNKAQNRLQAMSSRNSLCYLIWSVLFLMLTHIHSLVHLLPQTLQLDTYMS